MNTAPVRRVVIFDDDPTGTQTSSGVDVLLDDWDVQLDTFFASDARALFLLTNTRAMPEWDAVALVGDLRRRVDAAAARNGGSWTLVLRGDSTLRGHVFAEIDAVAPSGAPVLFVPAFPEGGRTTIDREQRIVINGIARNVADTEFARDATFGFRSRDLVSWVAEIGHGRPANVVPIAALRATAGAAVADALRRAGEGEVVIPEAQTLEDLVAVDEGLRTVEAEGRAVIVRSAASFAAIRAGLHARSIDRVPLADGGRVLVVCGSHMGASTAQLDALEGAGYPVRQVEPGASTPELLRALSDDLELRRCAVVATPRAVAAGSDLSVGATFMAALLEIAATVAPTVDAIVAKGGITSASVARSVGATVARVEGQLASGVSLWSLPIGSRRLPYAVVPGNVGGPTTLVSILGQMGLPAAPPLPAVGRAERGGAGQ